MVQNKSERPVLASTSANLAPVEIGEPSTNYAFLSDQSNFLVPLHFSGEVPLSA